MPVTKGHEALIRFAANYAVGTGGRLVVMLNTQPEEPAVNIRKRALNNFCKKLFREYGWAGSDEWEFKWVNETLEQDSSAPGFWDTWRVLLKYVAGWGHAGDVVITSDDYGRDVAALFEGCRWVPFDGERSVVGTRGTSLRGPGGLRAGWSQVSDEFARESRMKVTVFGAESCGKTTLARDLGTALRLSEGSWVPEWAREYLGRVDGRLSVEAMAEIWAGQKALQQTAWEVSRDWVVVQDTDLFSTVGYWDFWGGAEHGLPDRPVGLLSDAEYLKSDLYLLVSDNIPFESDPLRYGGDKREQDMEYWRGVCKRYGLPYRIISSTTQEGRLQEAAQIVMDYFDMTRNLVYTRRGQ